jgi:Toastrack DUF4097
MPVFDTPGLVALEIRLPAGHVTVNTADTPSTDVELLSHGDRGEEALEQILVSAREQPGGHVVSVEQRERFRWGPISINRRHEVEVRITCPLGSDLRFDGASCDLGAAGRFGKVEAKTASGDLRLGEISGKLQAKTASGGVSVQAIEAEGAVVTVSGDVELGRVDAALNTRTVSGDVELAVVRAPVTIATTSGDVAVRAVERGEVRIQTVSGEARVGVGEGTAVWLDASSVSGELRSELGTLEEKVSDTSGEVVPLRVKTVSGDVTFVRGVVGAGV